MRTAVLFVLLLAASEVAQPLAAQVSQPLDSATLSTFRWRSIGPANMSGRVTDVEGLASPSKTFYVAAAGGGIWKTTNNGTTFKSLFDVGRVISMGDLAIAPSDENQIWAGTGEEDSRNSISPGAGIYKSMDGGETWELKGLEATQAIGRIVVHPRDANTVYVAALGHIWDSNPERGLYRTRDGGDSWELVKFISDKAGFVDVAMHPFDPNVLFAASWERVRGPYFLQSGGPGSGLWKTVDGGDTWTEVVGGGFPTLTKGRIGLAISASSPEVMYAMVEAENEADGSGGNGLYRSADGGATWEKVNDANTRPFYYSQVRVDPLDPDRVYFSSTPVQFSDDGGRTAGTTTNSVHVDHHAMWIDPVDTDRIIVGNDGGAAISFDRGGNWQVLNHMAMGQFYHVSYNMDVPYRVCGGLQDNGTWCAPSRVARGGISNHEWASISGGDGFQSAQDAQDPDLVWSESQGGNMGRSNLATGERTSLQKPDWMEVWRPYQDTIVTLLEQGVSEGDARIRSLRQRASADSTAYDLRYDWNTPLFQSVHDRSHFYTAGNRVLKSTAFGDDLKVISPDLTYADAEKILISTETTGGVTVDRTGAETYATIVALAESPLRQGLLYAGTDDGRVWLSADDGGAWTELTDRFPGVPAGTWVSRIEPSHHDAERVYVSYDGHRTNDLTPHVFVSDDGGESFRSIAGNLPTGSVDFVHVVREDPRNPNLLFVGTDVGAYMSLDRGGSWQRFMSGLPTVPVHDLQIHPRDRELIAGTHGRSIWIVDIAPLQDLTDRVLADGAGLFEPAPAFQFGREARGGESTGQRWWSRPTPGSEARISYYLGADAASAVAESAGGGDGGDGAARAGGGGAAGAGAARAGQARGGQGRGGPAGARRGAGPGARGGPQLSITITDADGEVVQTLNGPASAGLHTVTWNLRATQPPAEPKSPWQVKDSIQVAARALFVTDSLVEAGWDEAPLRRMMGVFTGETDRAALFGGRGGPGGGRGGGAGGDPEAFRDRPGEAPGGGGAGPDFGQMRTLANIVRPGAGLGALFGRGGGGAAPLAEPGTYTVTMSVGERTLTQQITVERKGSLTGGNSPFEEGR